MLYNINLVFSSACQEQSLSFEKPEVTSNPLQVGTSEIIRRTSLLALQGQFQALARAFSKAAYPEERNLIIHAFLEAANSYQQFSELKVVVNLEPMSTNQNAHNLEFNLPSNRLLSFLIALSNNFDLLEPFTFKEENTSTECNENALLPLVSNFQSHNEFSVNEYANFLGSSEYSSDIFTLFYMKTARRAINLARDAAIAAFSNQISLFLSLPLQSMTLLDENMMYSVVEQLQMQRKVLLDVFQ